MADIDQDWDEWHAVIKETIMTEVWGLGAGNTATKNLERQRRSRQSDLI